MIKTVAAAGLLVLVQGTAPPAVDQLHDVVNAELATTNVKVRMELSGCMRDDRITSAVTCHYRLSRLSIAAKADQAKGPFKTMKVELQGGKDDANTMAVLAGTFAMALIPKIREDDLRRLNRSMANGAKDVFGDANETVESYVFRYHTDSKKTTLDIESTAGMCTLGKTC